MAEVCNKVIRIRVWFTFGPIPAEQFLASLTPPLCFSSFCVVVFYVNDHPIVISFTLSVVLIILSVVCRHLTAAQPPIMVTLVRLSLYLGARNDDMKVDCTSDV